jgi:hypothetical protein
MVLHPLLRKQLAESHIDRLREDSAPRKRTTPDTRSGGSPDDAAIAIRPNRPEDELALARLAQLDSSSVPAAPMLVLEVDGQLRAALSLRDGAAIADPFHRTAPLLALLTARAEQLLNEPTSVRARVRLAQLIRKPKAPWSSSSTTSAASRTPPT